MLGQEMLKYDSRRLQLERLEQRRCSFYGF
jgi:hypothetical protein